MKIYFLFLIINLFLLTGLRSQVQNYVCNGDLSKAYAVRVNEACIPIPIEDGKTVDWSVYKIDGGKFAVDNKKLSERQKAIQEETKKMADEFEVKSLSEKNSLTQEEIEKAVKFLLEKYK